MISTKKTLLLSAISLFSASMILAKTEEAISISTHKTKLDNKIETIVKEEIVCISGKEIMDKSEAGEALQAKLQSAQEEATKSLKEEETKLLKKQQQLQAAQAEAQSKQQELQAKKDALDADVVEFEKTAPALSEEARNKKIEPLQARGQSLVDDKRKFDRMVQALEDDGVEFNRMQQKLQADIKKVESKMQALYQKEMNPFDALVKETIQEVAQREGWYMVLMQESLVYAHPSRSKTQLIVTELNKKTKAINQAKKQAIEKNNMKKETSVSKDSPKQKKSESIDSDENIKAYG